MPQVAHQERLLAEYPKQAPVGRMQEAIRCAWSEANSCYGPNGEQASNQGQPARGARNDSMERSQYNDRGQNSDRGRSAERGNRGE